MWIDICYLFLAVTSIVLQQKVSLSNINMAERQTLDQQHAVDSQSPSASKEDMITYVMALEAALLPCLPARELQAIDRSPHPSHQSKSPHAISKLTQSFYMHVVQSSRMIESCSLSLHFHVERKGAVLCCMWERVWIGSEKSEGTKSKSTKTLGWLFSV